MGTRSCARVHDRTESIFLVSPMLFLIGICDVRQHRWWHTRLCQHARPNRIRFPFGQHRVEGTRGHTNMLARTTEPSPFVGSNLMIFIVVVFVNEFGFQHCHFERARYPLLASLLPAWPCSLLRSCAFEGRLPHQRLSRFLCVVRFRISRVMRTTRPEKPSTLSPSRTQ